MIGRREIRNAVAGALVFFAAGMVQACAGDTLLSPEDEQVISQTTTEDDGDPIVICKPINGTYICK